MECHAFYKRLHPGSVECGCQHVSYMAGHLFRLLPHGFTAGSIWRLLDCPYPSCIKSHHVNLCVAILDYEEVAAYHPNRVPASILCFSLINLQFVYSAYDAFYWYNGAMYYTLYFSMSLCLASLLIAYHYPENPKVFCWHPGCAPHYFIAGGNLYQALELLPYFSSPLPSLTWSRRSCQSFSPAFCWFIWLPSLSVFWHQETHSASWP